MIPARLRELFAPLSGLRVRLAYPVVRRHAAVLVREAILSRRYIRQDRVEALDRRALSIELALKLLDPRSPRGLPRPLADVAGLVLAPGAAQHPVGPPPVRGHPCRAAAGGPRPTSDSTQNGCD